MHMSKDTNTLSVVIPIRSTKNYDVVKRLVFKRRDTTSKNIEFIVVDDGSDLNGSQQIKEMCDALKYKYLRIDSEDKYFSLARARNYGVQNARGKYVMLEDVDFFPYEGFYTDIVNEIDNWELDKRQEDFFTIPAIWLTEKSATEITGNNSIQIKNKILQKYLEYDTDYFEFGVPCGSVVVVSKHHYLSIGGQNEKFDRWGFEDHEFANRLLAFSCKFPDPINKYKYCADQYKDYTKYIGFRSRYRLYGDIVAAKGIVTFHIPHPISKEFRTPKIREENEVKFNECVSRLEKNPYYLGSLVDRTSSEKTLLTSKNPFIYNNELWPLFGDVYFYDDGLHSKEDFLKFIEQNKITTMVMQNPYKKEQKLEIYKFIKAHGIRCIVAERGALPQSVYFDETGFCCESTRYSEKYWDRNLTESEKSRTIEYIRTFKSSGASLEKQGLRIGGIELRKHLQISNEQKILFVTFQTREDATVTYFAGKIRNYDNFVKLVEETVEKLPKDWVLVYKNHPLESTKISLDKAICGDEYHINDILEAADMVLLMNSGCGLLSIIYDVPVLHCSIAQYDNLKFNRYISTSDEVIEYCQNPFKVDREAALRFLHYLVFEFYSFAENVFEKRKGKPDSWPVRLIFNKIIYPGKAEVCYYRDKSKAVWRNSVIFDRYRDFMSTQYLELKKKKVSSVEKNKKQQPSVKKASISPKIQTQEAPKNKTHSIEEFLFSKILNDKLLAKYKKDRDLYFKDSKNFIAKLYYSINS